MFISIIIYEEEPRQSATRFPIITIASACSTEWRRR